MGRRQAPPPWLFAAATLALAAAALLAADPAAASQPAPTNHTVLPTGDSTTLGTLNSTSPVWFLVPGKVGDTWTFNITGEGAWSWARRYDPIGNGSLIQLAYRVCFFAGSFHNPTLTYEQPFYNNSSFFVELAVWPGAPNMSDPVNFTLHSRIAPMPTVAPGTPATAQIFDDGAWIRSYPYLRFQAARHDRVTLTMDVHDAAVLPPGDLLTFANIYTFERPYSGHDNFPFGWNRYVGPYGQPPEFWAWQILNHTRCVGFPCLSSIDIVAPYDGWYFVYLFAGGPADLRINVSISTVPNASLDWNDHMDDAVSLFHVPSVSGNLSTGIDAMDWYRLPLQVGDSASLSFSVNESYRDVLGGPFDTYEVAVLTPDGLRAVAVANTSQEPSGSALSFNLPRSTIGVSGDYLIKVTVTSARLRATGVCVDGNCTPVPNETGMSFATYTITLQQPNLGPNAVATPLVVQGTEDTPLPIDLAGRFTDPESDPLMYSLGSHPLGTSATVNGSVLTITPPPDFNGELVFTVLATDWFGAVGALEVHVQLDPVPDPPRFNASAVPSPLTWNRSETSDALDLSPIVFDPDGEPLTISAVAVPSILVIRCGDLCLRFRGQPNETYGNFTATVHAQDPAGLSALLTVNLSIRFANLRPTKAASALDPITLVARPLGVTLSSDTTCIDADGDPTTVHYHGTLLGLPEEAVTVTLLGSDIRIAVPDEAHVGSWAVRLACSDQGGEGPAFAIGLIIVPPFHPPELVSASPAVGSPSTAPENSSLAFSAYFTDRDNDSLTYAWEHNGLPIEGATTNTTTVEFGYHSAGENNITLTVTDPTGIVVQVTWNIHVTEVVSPPVCGILATQMAGAPGELANVSSLSYSPGSDLLFYLWTANGSFVSNTSVAQVAFVDGTLVVRLRVTSGTLQDECEVTLVGVGEAAPPPGQGDPPAAGEIPWLPVLAAVAIAGAAGAALVWRRLRAR